MTQWVFIRFFALRVWVPFSSSRRLIYRNNPSRGVGFVDQCCVFFSTIQFHFCQRPGQTSITDHSLSIDNTYGGGKNRDSPGGKINQQSHSSMTRTIRHRTAVINLYFTRTRATRTTYGVVILPINIMALSCSSREYVSCVMCMLCCADAVW